MANQFFMAIGLDYSGDENIPKKQVNSIKNILQEISSSLKIKDIGRKDKIIIEFNDYKDAEKLIGNIYSYSDKENKSKLKQEIIYFYIIIIFADSDGLLSIVGTSVDLLKSVITLKIKNLTHPVQIYITKEVYDSLPPNHQDLYHSKFVLDGTDIHERYTKDTRRCFVVSPIGEKGSDIRDRSDYVFETYIKPSCGITNYRAVRGDMQRGNKIMDDVIESLQSDSMAIVYLGNPKWNGWNPNVMFELGIRVGNSLPYVIIKDSTSNGERYELPFDIKDIRIVDISEQEDILENIFSSINTIKIQIQDNHKLVDSVHPYGIVKLNYENKSFEYIEASDNLVDLFGCAVIGKDLSEVNAHLLNLMPENQKKPYILEQDRLIYQLISPKKDAKYTQVSATIPIVFKEHSTYQGKAFLPFIVEYNYSDNILTVKVLYVDVTSVTIKNNEGVYISNLSGSDNILPDFFDQNTALS